MWTYAILFIIIFCETGLVVTPVLPGDSLLFTAGALGALGNLNVWSICGLLIVAAVLGDMVNYWAGHYFGARIFKPNARFLKTEHLDRTNAFYAKHGPKTIVIARFVPFVRTFAPFVAGMGRMRYGIFFTYNVIGAILWVVSAPWPDTGSATSPGSRRTSPSWSSPSSASPCCPPSSDSSNPRRQRRRADAASHAGQA